MFARAVIRRLPRASVRVSQSRALSHLVDPAPLTPSQQTVRTSLAPLLTSFPDSYWSNCDATATYPKEFHKAMADAGWLGIALPEAVGGSGLGISEAAVMLMTVAEVGGMQGAQSLHANVYATQPVARFVEDKDKAAGWLSGIVEGRDRMCFGVTEPNTGLETLKLKTRAERQADGSYLVTGEKM